jgi:predicted nucleic acid-binding protein
VFVTGDLILAEVLQGFRTERDFRNAKKALLSFEGFRMSGEDNAIRSAQNFRYLRDHGFTVSKTIDCLIATFCLSKDFQLLHSNRDFDPFEKLLGLRVVSKNARKTNT